ncbi:MAG: hypothetical protein V4638_05790 [Bacteroidota bacterium]
MKGYGLFFTVLLAVVVTVMAGCSLNARQEASLSRSVTNYLEAKRNGVTLAYVSMIHPDFVRYYVEKGDSSFKEKFTETQKDHYVDDATIQTIVSEGASIHVLYKVKAVGNYYTETSDSTEAFLALSANDGESWFFVQDKEYFDVSINPTFKRLITKK